MAGFPFAFPLNVRRRIGVPATLKEPRFSAAGCGDDPPVRSIAVSDPVIYDRYRNDNLPPRPAEGDAVPGKQIQGVRVHARRK